MTPLKIYLEQVQAGKLTLHPEQQAVLEYLTQVRERLVKSRKFLRLIPKKRSATGLYLWGGVGIGKTLIMDLFFESLPIPKLRLHLHAFMRRVHQELTQWQGRENPLVHIGKRLSQQYSVICFDEFIVTNVADAMIMAELFKTLFDQGVCLVTTSNVAPEKLYESGLQRERFLPVITLLEQHTRVWHLPLTEDYRKKNLAPLSSFVWPFSEKTEQSLYHSFLKFSGENTISSEPLRLLERDIPVKLRSSQVIWFEFNDICGRPRSQNDYLALVEQFTTILVSHVPCLENLSKDLVVSFIYLVDILYDAQVKFLLSAAVPIESLYTCGEFKSLFQRTESRLIEMALKN
jgi:cell division protein ZapE